MARIRIATRESQLALWQAHEVARLLRRHHADNIDIDIIGMTTEGDRFLQAALASAGGKGLFVKELEQCLLDQRADIAVHSMKDVPYELPDSLAIHAMLARADARDAFVSNQFKSIDELPARAVVGTSSARRACQLRAARHDVNIQPLRGNVNTRLAKLDSGQYDAIILASAGLKRLGLANRISSLIAIESSLPAIGQGAIGIECRHSDAATQALLAPLHDPLTALSVNAERAISAALSADCHLPVAAHAVTAQGRLKLEALVGLPDGSKIIRARASDSIENSAQITRRVVARLRAQGADAVMDRLRINH